MMIEVKNLSVQTSKGVKLLDHVEFTLKTGSCTGLTLSLIHICPSGVEVALQMAEARKLPVVLIHPDTGKVKCCLLYTSGSGH